MVDVLIVCDTFYPDINGAAKFADRLAAGLIASGNDVAIVAPATNFWNVGRFDEVVEKVSMPIFRARSFRWPGHDWLRVVFPFGTRRYARKILSDLKPATIHAQSHIFLGRAFLFEAKKLGIPVVLTNHLMPENAIEHFMLPKPVAKLVMKRVLSWSKKMFSFADVVTTPTRLAAEYMLKSGLVKDVKPISCGIDLNNYVPQFSSVSKNGEISLLFVGRVTGEKCISVAIEAMQALPPALAKKCVLHIVGGGDQLENLSLLVKKMDISGRVIFHGRVSDDDLRIFYRDSHIWVMPSVAELQSIATLEAMASGMPVILANAMALPHLVVDGVNGFLFKPSSVDDLVGKIVRLCELDDETFVSFGRASYEIAKSHDFALTVKAFSELYQDIS